jgi:hypothetical protein
MIRKIASIENICYDSLPLSKKIMLYQSLNPHVLSSQRAEREDCAVSIYKELKPFLERLPFLNCISAFTNTLGLDEVESIANTVLERCLRRGMYDPLQNVEFEQYFVTSIFYACESERRKLISQRTHLGRGAQEKSTIFRRRSIKSYERLMASELLAKGLGGLSPNERELFLMHNYTDWSDRGGDQKVKAGRPSPRKAFCRFFKISSDGLKWKEWHIKRKLRDAIKEVC